MKTCAGSRLTSRISGRSTARVSLTPVDDRGNEIPRGDAAVFKKIVEEFALRPAGFSKYRLGIEAARPGVGGSSAAARRAEIAALKAANA
jgi:hypothetical protein